MAKKKKAPKALVLGFKREWIFDPGPEYWTLNRATIAKLNQLKAAFTKNVNAVIKQG